MTQPRPVVQLGDYYGPEPRKLLSDGVDDDLSRYRSTLGCWLTVAASCRRRRAAIPISRLPNMR